MTPELERGARDIVTQLIETPMAARDRLRATLCGNDTELNSLVHKLWSSREETEQDGFLEKTALLEVLPAMRETATAERTIRSQINGLLRPATERRSESPQLESNSVLRPRNSATSDETAPLLRKPAASCRSHCSGGDRVIAVIMTLSTPTLRPNNDVLTIPIVSDLQSVASDCVIRPVPRAIDRDS